MFQKIVDVNVVYDYELYRLMKKKKTYLSTKLIFILYFFKVRKAGLGQFQGQALRLGQAGSQALQL